MHLMCINFHITFTFSESTEAMRHCRGCCHCRCRSSSSWSLLLLPPLSYLACSTMHVKLLKVFGLIQIFRFFLRPSPKFLIQIPINFQTNRFLWLRRRLTNFWTAIFSATRLIIINMKQEAMDNQKQNLIAEEKAKWFFRCANQMACVRERDRERRCIDTVWSCKLARTCDLHAIQRQHSSLTQLFN